VLSAGKSADEYSLYKKIKNTKMGDLTRAILYLKRKKIIHVTGHRRNSRTGMRIPIYSLSSNKALLESEKMELMIFEELHGGFSSGRSVEYSFLASNFFPTNTGMRILDVGSGRSELTRLISKLGGKRGWEVYGIDISKFELVNDEKTLPSVMRMDARLMGFRDNVFDWIICISTLEHIGIDLSHYLVDKVTYRRGDLQALSEIFRILKKSGRVVLTIPFTDYRVERSESISRKYTSELLSELAKDFQIKKEEFYVYVNGIWRPCNRSDLEHELRANRYNTVPNYVESLVCLGLILEK